MSVRTRVVVAAWLASLVAVGTVARGQTFAFTPLPEVMIMSGEDIGFRVEGWRGSVPAGRLVIRVDEQWVEVRESMMHRPVR